MNDNPTVSVIILTYNRRDLLKETLESVLSQSFKDFEVLIIDNHSNYDIQNFVDGFNDKRLKLFQNHNNGFLAVNRNFGMRQAKGSYIAFCDDDDHWLPQKLEAQLKVFNEKKDVLLVGTNGEVFPKIRKNMLFYFSDKVIDIHYLIKHKKGVLLSSVLFKKQLLSEIGFLDEDPDILALEDLDYWLKILKYQDKSIYILKEDLIRYREHEANMLTSVDKEGGRYKKVLKILKKYPEEAAPYIHYLERNMDYISHLHMVYSQLYDRSVGLKSIWGDQKIKLKDKMVMTAKNLILRVVSA